ncbi:MAG: hypothetical protein U0528_06360 [Anaerolineae bacterium]
MIMSYTLADQTADEVYGLFHTLVTGGESTQLNPPELKVGANYVYAITPDGANLIFNTDDGKFNRQVFGVPITGGDAIALTDKIRTANYYFVPGSDKLVITRDNILYSIATTSGQSISVPQSLYACCIVSPNGDYVLVVGAARGAAWAATTLYSFSVESGTITQLTQGALPVREWTALFSPDGKFVVFVQTDANKINNYYSAPADGSSPAVQLNAFPGTVSFGNYRMAITADSSTLIHINDEEAKNFSDIYSVPIAGGDALRLTPDDSAGVQRFQLYPEGTRWDPQS